MSGHSQASVRSPAGGNGHSQYATCHRYLHHSGLGTATPVPPAGGLLPTPAPPRHAPRPFGRQKLPSRPVHRTQAHSSSPCRRRWTERRNARSPGPDSTPGLGSRRPINTFGWRPNGIDQEFGHVPPETLGMHEDQLEREHSRGHTGRRPDPRRHHARLMPLSQVGGLLRRIIEEGHERSHGAARNPHPVESSGANRPRPTWA
jgi:hypothetical protein